jgi:formamidopyrimidine-DNA glycosylase
LPELPEVETILRSLKSKVLHQRIEKVTVINKKTIKKPEPEVFTRCLKEQEITGLDRHGKYLLFEISSSMVMVVHLRMSGRLVYKETAFQPGKYTCVIFYLEEGRELHFQDMRKFGTMHLIRLAEVDVFPPLSILGPDALDPQLTLEHFIDRLQSRRGPVKGVLLNQSFIAGIGNIYANEILWVAGIHPERKADSLQLLEQEKLYQATRDVLETAVKYRGTTLRDYVDGDGNRGEYQKHLRAHGREGEPCPRCGHPIIRIKQCGRSSYYCDLCQK